MSSAPVVQRLTIVAQPSSVCLAYPSGTQVTRLGPSSSRTCSRGSAGHSVAPMVIWSSSWRRRSNQHLSQSNIFPSFSPPLARSTPHQRTSLFGQVYPKSKSTFTSKQSYIYLKTKFTFTAKLIERFCKIEVYLHL